MRFTIPFKNCEGERRDITASLSAREVESVESLRRYKGCHTADEAASAYALHAAYREVPRGFEHVGPPMPSNQSESQARRVREGVA